MAFEFNNVFSGIQNQFNAFTSSVKSGVSSLAGIKAPVAMPGGSILAYPTELRSSKANWPYVRFGIVDGPGIFLPIPPGVIIADSANYSSIDLGIVEGAMNMIQAFNENRSEGVGAALGSAVGEIKNDVKGYSALAGQIAAKNAGFERISAASAITGRKIAAPRTNIIFQNMGVRGFNFSFKMVAKNKDDSNTIKNIIDTFRHNAYPTAEASGSVLNFPSQWTIDFYEGESKNQYLPQIKKCQLVAMNATYNSSTNMFHEDGSPIEVDISLQFQEVKALVRQDVESDDSDYYKG